jgi:hypothetical protein
MPSSSPNAAKSNPARGAARHPAAPTARFTCSIRVRDTGIGVPHRTSSQAHLRFRFRTGGQLHHAASYGGTGPRPHHIVAAGGNPGRHAQSRECGRRGQRVPLRRSFRASRGAGRAIADGASARAPGADCRRQPVRARGHGGNPECRRHARGLRVRRPGSAHGHARRARRGQPVRAGDSRRGHAGVRRFRGRGRDQGGEAAGGNGCHPSVRRRPPRGTGALPRSWVCRACAKALYCGPSCSMPSHAHRDVC